MVHAAQAPTPDGVIVVHIDPDRGNPTWQEIAAACAHSSAQWFNRTGLNPPSTICASGDGWDELVAATPGYTYRQGTTTVRICPSRPPMLDVETATLPDLPDSPTPPPLEGDVPLLYIRVGRTYPGVAGAAHVASRLAVAAASLSFAVNGAWLRDGTPVRMLTPGEPGLLLSPNVVCLMGGDGAACYLKGARGGTGGGFIAAA